MFRILAKTTAAYNSLSVVSKLGEERTWRLRRGLGLPELSQSQLRQKRNNFTQAAKAHLLTYEYKENPVRTPRLQLPP